MARKTTYERHSDQFKLTAVALANSPDVLTKDVAHSLDIYPFMLSRWKRDVREGRLVAKKKIEIDLDTQAELVRLRKLERDHKRLQLEHELLKKKIQYGLEQKQADSRSSKSTVKKSQ